MVDAGNWYAHNTHHSQCSMLLSRLCTCHMIPPPFFPLLSLSSPARYDCLANPVNAARGALCSPAPPPVTPLELPLPNLPNICKHGFWLTNINCRLSQGKITSWPFDLFLNELCQHFPDVFPRFNLNPVNIFQKK